MSELMLYPLKFKTIFKDKIWGGDKIKTILNKDFSPLSNCGETWEISGIENEQSVVENGFLAGNELNELVETYMGELVGEKVFEIFGDQFPLLIKFIDANDNLSVQVHPNDAMAITKHKSYGKTEMWYVLQADENAKIITGFNQEIDNEKYLNHLQNGTLNEILNFEDAKVGDVFFIPAGRIHAIGKGVLLAEIQQTSDITYRVFDWNRIDNNGIPRELNTDLALDALDFKLYKNYKQDVDYKLNNTIELVKCNHFVTNFIEFDQKVEKIYAKIDSFVIYMCIDGSFNIKYDGGIVKVKKGETILIPAVIEEVLLIPNKKAKVLEVFIP